MLLLVPAFLLAAALCNPIYLELRYSDHELGLFLLPPVFGGWGRGMKLSLPPPKSHGQDGGKPRGLARLRSHPFHRAKAYISALALERLSLQGLGWENPALAAPLCGLPMMLAGAFGRRYFFRRAVLELRPFSREPGQFRILFRFSITRLILHSFRRRLGR